MSLCPTCCAVIDNATNATATIRTSANVIIAYRVTATTAANVPKVPILALL